MWLTQKCHDKKFKHGEWMVLIQFHYDKDDDKDIAFGFIATYLRRIPSNHIITVC